eukprot:gnl/TRDRNA2_/TRDRNA2_161907_c4_seq1.p1 gnl/TRDRNA2_/TRDRNA2_161907_c4~~gnl/TRDRNA2_/TRDRNA2_161907_c4_seq1.p1  ORF type:complete len:289 (+),score=91.53 gnl/TRDRNA2_/TRDRNA2_161907_c4_seq1:42-869(+)
MGDDPMDALFGTLMNEINNTKSKKIEKKENELGSPEELIALLTSGKYEAGLVSAFQIFKLPPETPDDQITKQYRKLSILIHPDKCKIDGANEAFQLLVKVHSDAKDPACKEKFKGVVDIARKRVRAQREKENKVRVKQGQDPLDLEGNEFEKEVLEECERMKDDGEKTATYTNSVLEANMKRVAEERAAAKKVQFERDKEKRQWEKHRDKRVAGWQTFINKVETKKFKTDTHMGYVGAGDYNHKREERKDYEEEKLRREDKLPTGVDRKYRQAWR